MGNQVRYIKKICGISSDSITEENIDDVYKIISEYGPQYVEDKYEVPYDIAKLMMPSILFYKMFMSKDKNKIIIAPEISLVDGILVEYVEKNAYTHTKHIFTDDIISSAKYYAGKYDVSHRHYTKIMEFGVNIMATLSKKFGLSKRHTVLLKVASIFADTGYYININDYSKYSYDIVKSKNRRLLISKLAAILSLAKSLDVEYNQKIDEIKTSIRNGILTITAYTDSDISLEEREFNLKKLLGDIVNVVEKQSKEHQLEIVQCDYQIEHWNLIGSPIHIKRMLMNILSNAVKYNRYNGKIILDCREVSCIGNVALIEFICKDTGIGMSKEFQEHIFEPFAQEFNSARSSFGGTGLGMPIAKSLVETMGGNIEFESEKNVGTTFRLKIPFKIDDCVHIEEPTEEEHNVSIEGVRVLVAEDNDLNMEITEFVLSSVGAVVIKASNGQEAIEIFEKSEVGEIDIILMDVMMPGVDGLAATRIILSMSREDAKTIPIIAMTANAFSEDRLRAVEAGMNEHLAKPLESTVIIKTIAKYLKEE